MREIRFRGKRLDNGEWVYGYYTRNNENNTCYITTQTNTGGAHPWRVDPETVGEWTGLKDKAGRDIYEGDILGDIFADGYIGYCDKCKAFALIASECIGCLGDVQWREIVAYEELEVVGNRYDNPELLEESGTV